MRVLAVDPGLTRCGVAVVDQTSAGRLRAIEVTVIRSTPEQELAERLGHLHAALVSTVSTHGPDVVVVERVFSQMNVTSAMTTAQAAAMAMLAGVNAGLPVHQHTPTEVKAAVTGSGSADKNQVAYMVTKILGLRQTPQPADATDALALAICHIWRSRRPIGARR